MDLQCTKHLAGPFNSRNARPSLLGNALEDFYFYLHVYLRFNVIFIISSDYIYSKPNPHVHNPGNLTPILSMAHLVEKKQYALTQEPQSSRFSF